MSDPTTDTPNRTHTDYAEAGYTVIPIIPPSAELSEQSRIPADQRGKVPGIRKQDGTWVGLHGWAEAEANPKRMGRWTESGAGVGLLCGSRGGIVAVDIDVTDEEVSQAIQKTVLDLTGPAPVRVGRAPKSLVLLRLREGEEVSHSKVKFALEDGTEHLVEVLGKGKQFVAEGVHPKTGRAYVWSGRDPVEDFTRIPVIGRADLATLMDTIQNELILIHGAEILSARSVTGEVTGVVDQETLKAPDLDEAERLVRALPNNDELEEVTGEAGRDHWVMMGYAIRAAFQDDPGLGEELWLDWCGRWESGEDGVVNDPDLSVHEWNKMRGPYRVGWGLLQRCAAALSPEERTRQAQSAFGGSEGGGEDLPEDPVDDLLASCVFVKTAGAYYDFRDGTMVRPDIFNRAHKHITGKKNAATILDAKGQKVKGFTYSPQGGRILMEDGQPHANTYTPTPMEAEGWVSRGPDVTEDQISMWLRLAEVIVPDQREREILFDWLAFQIQHPGVKCNWHPLIIGKQGSGKDSLLRPLKQGFGGSVAELDPGLLKSEYNDWVLGNRLVIWGEINTSGRRDIEDVMKKYLVDEPSKISIIEKYVGVYKYPNIANHIMLTNRRSGLHLSGDDRRIFVIDAESRPLMGSEFFEMYRRWTRGRNEDGLGCEPGPGSELVVRWLGRRVITENMKGRAPETEAKRDMMVLSLGAVSGEIVSRIESKTGLFARDLMTASEIVTEIAPALKSARVSLSANSVAGHLKEMDGTGMFHMHFTRDEDGEQVRSSVKVWAVRNAEKYRAMKNTGGVKALVEEYRRQCQQIVGGSGSPFDSLDGD